LPRRKNSKTKTGIKIKMNKEKFIIGIGMIVASIFFTFIGIIMLIIFLMDQEVTKK
jgi:hypothetical protein